MVTSVHCLIQICWSSNLIQVIRLHPHASCETFSKAKEKLLDAFWEKVVFRAIILPSNKQLLFIQHSHITLLIIEVVRNGYDFPKMLHQVHEF